MKANLLLSQGFLIFVKSQLKDERLTLSFVQLLNFRRRAALYMHFKFLELVRDLNLARGRDHNVFSGF